MEMRITSKEELLILANNLYNKNIRRNLSDIDQTLLHTLEYIHYVDVVRKANERKAELTTYKPNEFLHFYLPEGKTRKDISKQCHGCLGSKMIYIRHTDQCNCSCDFCYYYGTGGPIIPKWAYTMGGDRFNVDEIETKLILEKQILNNVLSVSWLGKEPLLDVGKAESIMRFVADHGKHQCLYTNGVCATDDNLKRLKDFGLNEIRFNLQATNFSEKVLKHFENACTIFDTVCAETPVYSKSYNNYLKYKDRIVNSGVSQINLPELQVNAYNLHLFKDEGQIYRHRRGYVSPISSREYVHKLIKLAIEESWPIIINDCSNDTKFFRGVKKNLSKIVKCKVEYQTEFQFLPPQYYEYVINKYVDVGMEW